MRYVAVTALALVVLSAVGLYVLRSEPPPASRGTSTPTATATVSTTPSATVSASSSPSPSPSDVSVDVSRTTVPAEFRYIVLGVGDPFRIKLLDLAAARAIDVATVKLPGPLSPGDPYPTMSSSRDGRVVLLNVFVPGAEARLFVLRPESAETKLLFRGHVGPAVISPDGTRFAAARRDDDRALNGLWIGTVLDGAMRRLVADDPQFAGAPPLPYAFSPNGSLLAFGLGMGESGYRAAIAPVTSAEGRADRIGGDVKVTGGEVSVLGPALRAEFINDREVFAWNSRGALGGQTVAYVHEIATKSTQELHRPAGDSLISDAAWRPAADQFAMLETLGCCGANRPQTAWLRGRDGSTKKLPDVAGAVGDLWWSPDGSRLYARVFGDDSTSAVLDLLTGNTVMAFCLRGGSPGSCT
jgi:hypothetical protein